MYIINQPTWFSSIDGETNLKLRRSVGVLAHVSMAMEEAHERVKALTGKIECEPPNMKINSFSGTIAAGDEDLPIDNDNVLLRGSVLRNTKWVIGIVVYTGKDTKLQVRV